MYPLILLCCILLATLACGCSNEQKGNQKYIEEGIAQYYEGKYKEALWSFERYLISDDNSATASYAWAWKGITYEELEKYDQALSCIDRAIQIRPNDPDLWRAKERILLHLGRNEEAAFAGGKAASLENPSLSPVALPSIPTSIATSPIPTVPPFTEKDERFVQMARNQTMQLTALSAQVTNLTPAEYRAHGTLFRSTASSFLQLAEKAKPEDRNLVRSWQYYLDALRQFALAGQYTEQAGKDFEANNFTAMGDSLEKTARFMDEGNRNLTLMQDSLDQSGIVY